MFAQTCTLSFVQIHAVMQNVESKLRNMSDEFGVCLVQQCSMLFGVQMVKCVPNISILTTERIVTGFASGCHYIAEDPSVLFIFFFSVRKRKDTRHLGKYKS